MSKKQKIIHLGIKEAKKSGKSLFKYLCEDVKEPSDAQLSYVKGYHDGTVEVIEMALPMLKELKRNNDQMLEIVRGH